MYRRSGLLQLIFTTMETPEQAITRILYRESGKYDEFREAYSNLKRQGGIRSKLFLLLRDAIYAAHELAIEYLWNEVQEHNLCVKGEEEILLAAAYMGNVKMLRLLTKNGASGAPFSAHELADALSRAASTCQLEAVRLILELGNYAGDDLDDALFSACEAPEMERVAVKDVAPVVKVLLAAGASPDPDLYSSWSALDEVTSNRDEETALLLMEYGAGMVDCKMRTYSWWSYDMPKVIHELIKRGMRGDDIVRDDNMTFLMEAAWHKDYETVKTLLELGADISLTDDNGLTALDYAIREQADDIVELLKSYQSSQ